MRHNIRVAVSLPQPVVSAVGALAEQRGESRSHFIATLLARVASAKRDREIRAEIDALFADPTVRAEQRDTAEAFLGASPWQREKPQPDKAMYFGCASVVAPAPNRGGAVRWSSSSTTDSIRPS